MLVWKVKVAGVLLGAGAVLGFWPIPPLCEQVLEKKKATGGLPSPDPVCCSGMWDAMEQQSQGIPAGEERLIWGGYKCLPGAILQARREAQAAEIHSQGC